MVSNPASFDLYTFPLPTPMSAPAASYATQKGDSSGAGTFSKLGGRGMVPIIYCVIYSLKTGGQMAKLEVKWPLPPPRAYHGGSQVEGCSQFHPAYVEQERYAMRDMPLIFVEGDTRTSMVPRRPPLNLVEGTHLQSILSTVTALNLTNHVKQLIFSNYI